jgi:hypothetical protein
MLARESETQLVASIGVRNTRQGNVLYRVYSCVLCKTQREEGQWAGRRDGNEEFWPGGRSSWKG